MVAVLGDIEDDDDDFGEAHDINVTPFIDVMLVLLIIFMVAAPLSTVDLPVDLPSSTAVPQPKPDKPIYVTIKSDLAVAIGETPVKRVDLVSSLDAMSGTMSGATPGEGKDRRIFLRADRTVPYGELMDVLERLRVGGFNKIALVAQEGVPGDPVNDCPPAGCNHLIVGTQRVWETITGSGGWYPASMNLVKGTLGNRSFINQLAFEPKDQSRAIVGTNDGNVQYGHGVGPGALGASAT